MSPSKNSLFLAPTLASIPVVVDPTCRIHISGYKLDNFKKFNPEGYTILCETSKYCDVLSFFPNTKTVVLEGNTQSYRLYSDFPNQFIPELAKEFDIDPASALEISKELFADKRVLVQPKGLQGKVYNIMRNIQNIGPVTHTFEAVSVLKTTGMTGVQIIVEAPLTFVSATYLAGMTCGYFGSIAGNNTVGLVLNTSSYVLTRPMRGVEITLNGLILQPLSNVTGLPLILNGTCEII